MSNTTTLVLVGVMCAGSVCAMVLIGRHYERACAEHRAYCDDMEYSASQLVENAQRERNAQDAQTEVLPRVRLPESPDSDDPPLLTHGQRTLYARAEGRHALPDRHPGAQPTDRGEPP